MQHVTKIKPDTIFLRGTKFFLQQMKQRDSVSLFYKADLESIGLFHFKKEKNI